jgi:hypothetical protein
MSTTRSSQATLQCGAATFTNPDGRQGSWTENQKRDELRSAGYRFGMLPGVKVEHVGNRDGFGY